MAADKSPSEKRQARDRPPTRAIFARWPPYRGLRALYSPGGRHTGAYARYIRQVVAIPGPTRAIFARWPPYRGLRALYSPGGRHTGAYARYIRQVVVDGKACKIGTDTRVLSFINPLKRSVPYLVRGELGTLKMEKLHALMG